MTTITINAANRSKKQTTAKLLKSALQREKGILKAGVAKTLSKLNEFEKKYNMSSKQFIEQYENGKTDDRNDYIDWAGEYQIYRSIKEQLALLEEIKI